MRLNLTQTKWYFNLGKNESAQKNCVPLRTFGKNTSSTNTHTHISIYHVGLMRSNCSNCEVTLNRTLVTPIIYKVVIIIVFVK